VLSEIDASGIGANRIAANRVGLGGANRLAANRLVSSATDVGAIVVPLVLVPPVPLLAAAAGHAVNPVRPQARILPIAADELGPGALDAGISHRHPPAGRADSCAAFRHRLRFFRVSTHLGS